MRRSSMLVTGATGSLGPSLLAELLAADSAEPVHVLVRSPGQPLDATREELCRAVRKSASNERLVADKLNRLRLAQGDIGDARFGDAIADLGSIETIIHAAASTGFRAPPQEQHRTNVQGTRNVLSLAAKCPLLRRFVFVSTTCVAGARAGVISEATSSVPPEFANAYEASKWEAEQLVIRSGLPAPIVRLSTVIGSERTGDVNRLGAIHRALQWMYRGLVPMVPGSADARVDFVSSESAGSCLAKCATIDGPVPEVIHVAAGERAVPLAELLDAIVEEFRARSSAWRHSQISRPIVVDRGTFKLFQESVRSTGDVLLCAVLDSVASFLPALLHPKVYETSRAQSLFGGPLPLGDWRKTLRRVIARSVLKDDRTILPREANYACSS